MHLHITIMMMHNLDIFSLLSNPLLGRHLLLCVSQTSLCFLSLCVVLSLCACTLVSLSVFVFERLYVCVFVLRVCVCMFVRTQHNKYINQPRTPTNQNKSEEKDPNEKSLNSFAPYRKGCLLVKTIIRITNVRLSFFHTKGKF